MMLKSVSFILFVNIICFSTSRKYLLHSDSHHIGTCTINDVVEMTTASCSLFVPEVALNTNQPTSLSLRFNGYFPGEPVLAGVY